MKVLAINGSPKPQGNTRLLIDKVAAELEHEGIETEVYQLGGQMVRGCMACGLCGKNRDGQCAITTDCLNECLSKARQADGLIIGSPTYFANVTAEVKAFIDRAGLVARANGDFLARKPAAAVVAVRRAGALPAYDAINHFFALGQMIVPAASYWNLGIGRLPGEVENDTEGLQTMATLGRNMAWLMKKLAIVCKNSGEKLQ